MSFAYPKILYLLILIPVIFGLWYWARMARRRKLRRFGNPGRLNRLMPEASPYKPAVKITLELLALACVIVAVARPRHGEKEEVETTSGIEVMICFDVSRSMLASSTDDARGIPRLDRAKYLLGNLVDRLSNDKIGLIVFAGESYTQLPMTTDFVSARMYLDEITTDMVQTQGTAIGAAINMAINSFTPAEDVNKAIIVITDGENHEGDAVEMAKYAKSLGIQVDVMGVGSIKGAPIPLSDGNFLKDNSGAPVTTFLNEKMAREIAEAGGGVYINGSSQKALSNLVDQLDKIKKSDLQHVTYKASAEQFPMFVWIALILLVIDAIVLPSKIGWLKRYSFFSRQKIAAKGNIRKDKPMVAIALLVLACAGLSSCSQKDENAPVSSKLERNLMKEGKSDFDKERYAEAEVNFQKVLELNPDNERAKFNLASSYIKQAGIDTANRNDSLLSRAAGLLQELTESEDEQIRKNAFYDLGNLAYVSEQYGQAVELYKQTLRLDPEDNIARDNLRLAQLKLQQQQDNQDNQDQNQQQQQEQEQEQEQQQQDQQNQQEQQNQQNQQNQQEQQQQQQQQQLSQQSAEQILKALDDKEAVTRRKLEEAEQNRERHRNARRVQPEKPW